jgi:rod shape-determining protein MreC
MESVFGRYRNLVVLVGVLFAQILGLAVQVRRARDKDSEPTRLIRVWAVGVVTPLEKALSWAQTSSGAVWHNYVYLRGVRAENRELKQQIEQMRLEQARIIQDADQAHRLQALLGFKEQFISHTVPAQVIGGTGSELSRSVYVDKGSNDGIKRDMAVITKDGIVGKILLVYPSVSLVLLIDDQTSGVGSILERSRLQGILRGTASGAVVLEKVMSDENVPEGEQVLTSGGDGIFPKGLNVGTVTKVSTGSDLFLNIRVRPAADLNRLEEVLVVTKVDEKQTEPDQGTRVRAADILAERLPSVPPKPEAAAAPGQHSADNNPANPNSALAPKTANPNSQLTAAPATAQSKPKPQTANATQKGDGTAQSNAGPPHVGGDKANIGGPKVSMTSAQGESARPQPAIEKKNAVPVPGAGNPAAGQSPANTSAGKLSAAGASAAGTSPGTGPTKKPLPKPVGPNAAAPPKVPPASEGTPQ